MPNVVFLEAAQPLGSDRFKVFFGAGDATIGSAIIKVNYFKSLDSENWFWWIWLNDECLVIEKFNCVAKILGIFMLVKWIFCLIISHLSLFNVGPPMK